MTKKDSKKIIDYNTSGVSLKRSQNVINTVQNYSKKSNLSLFAGISNLDFKTYKSPKLLACTDGIGTKICLLAKTNRYDVAAIDLVAMVGNDLVCHNAKPAFFLDYYACNKIIGKNFELFIRELAKQLYMIDCELLGGETAEMSALYKKNDFDISGFMCGIAEEAKIINGNKIISGDIIYGIETDHPHANGYSLIRKIFTSRDLNNQVINGKVLLDFLVKPTPVYVNFILTAVNQCASIHGLAHITGGGLYENIGRILPSGCHAQIQLNTNLIPSCFKLFKLKSNLTWTKLANIFNMGFGFVIIAPPKCKNQIIKLGKEKKLNIKEIGTIVDKLIIKENSKKVTINWI